MGCKDLVLSCCGWRKRQAENGFQAMPVDDETPRQSAEPGDNNQGSDDPNFDESDEFDGGHGGGGLSPEVNRNLHPGLFMPPPRDDESSRDDDDSEEDAPNTSSPVRHSSPIPIPARSSRPFQDEVLHVGSPPVVGILTQVMQREDEETALARAAMNRESDSDPSSSQTDPRVASSNLDLGPSRDRTRLAPPTASSSQTQPVSRRRRFSQSVGNQGASPGHVQPHAYQQGGTAATGNIARVRFAENASQRPGRLSRATENREGTVSQHEHGQGQSKDKQSSSSSSTSSSSSSSSSDN